MADEFYAANRIEYGEADETGNQVEVTVFEQDEKVTGLDEETMKQLWDSGSLYKKESNDDGEEDHVTANTGDVPSQPTPKSEQSGPGDLEVDDKGNAQTKTQTRQAPKPGESAPAQVKGHGATGGSGTGG